MLYISRVCNTSNTIKLIVSILYLNTKDLWKKRNFRKNVNNWVSCTVYNVAYQTSCIIFDLRTLTLCMGQRLISLIGKLWVAEMLKRKSLIYIKKYGILRLSKLSTESGGIHWTLRLDLSKKQSKLYKTKNTLKFVNLDSLGQSEERSLYRERVKEHDLTLVWM